MSIFKDNVVTVVKQNYRSEKITSLRFCCILVLRFPSVLLVFTRPLMGKLNFH